MGVDLLSLLSRSALALLRFWKFHSLNLKLIGSFFLIWKVWKAFIDLIVVV